MSRGGRYGQPVALWMLRPVGSRQHAQQRRLTYSNSLAIPCNKIPGKLEWKRYRESHGTLGMLKPCKMHEERDSLPAT